MAPAGTMAQADAAEEGTSRASGERDEEVSMSFTTEDIIRPEVGFLLRGDYRGKFLCSPCLVTLIRERLGTNLSTSKIERALDAVFKSPGAPAISVTTCGSVQCHDLRVGMIMETRRAKEPPWIKKGAGSMASGHVAAVRRGRSLRQVARDFDVGLFTVQRWVGRAHGCRLDQVPWADRSSRPRRTSRTPRPLEDLVLQVRQELRATSDLGEFGAAVIRAELLARDVVGVPSVRTVGRILERRGVLDARRRVRRPPPPRGWAREAKWR